MILLPCCILVVSHPTLYHHLVGCWPVGKTNPTCMLSFKVILQVISPKSAGSSVVVVPHLMAMCLAAHVQHCPIEIIVQSISTVRQIG